MSADWKPGYSTTKTRYPYHQVESIEQFKNRPELTIVDGKVIMLVDVNIYPRFKDITIDSEGAAENKQLMIDFLMDRLFDYSEALKTAEDQIKELLSEDPFIPEQFGFELVHKPETIHDSPIRIYQSKYDDNYTLHRPVQDVFDEKEWNPSIWILQKKKEDNTFASEELIIPCHRIAFAYFYAKGIKVMEEIKPDFIQDAEIIEEEVSDEEDNVKVMLPAGMNLYNVTYIEQLGAGRKHVIRNVIAEDDKDAQTKAKFLIETGEYGIEHVNFEELTPILKKSNK